MLEFPAKQAREILNNNNEWKAGFWYSSYKETLFEDIKSASLNGKDSLIIEADEWGHEDMNEIYLREKLKILGYSVRSEGDSGKCLIISW